MSWRKYFTPVEVNTNPSSFSPLTSTGKPGPARKNYSSFLPDVYTGAPNRVERYQQYDTMDMDSEVNAALDIIAEFCSQKNRENSTPFSLYFKSKATNSEVSILREYLQQWCKLQKFETRIFRIVRNVFKYGDCFFVRDPETYKWLHIDPAKIVKVIVNESDGKEPEQYVIRDLNPNFVDLAVTQINPSYLNTNQRGTNFAGPGGASATAATGSAFSGNVGNRFDVQQNELAIEAKHVVHLSLSEGLDNNYPFGNSLLENIFKVFKQKELLEDAILIYRIQRAPERRIFYIDVGNMPSHLAMGFVERVKNEIHQRRIPSASGGGQNIIDSAYNPLSVSEDYFFPTTAEGRGSKVDTLPGGCFSMDTRVPLLDGRVLTIAELADEYRCGKTNWTYSTNPTTGRVVPGIISWAGVTQKSAKVLRLTLDNGKEIVCTPEHKFPIFGKGLVEAQNLVVGESFIPFNTRNEHISNHKKLDYTQVYQNDTREWEFVHRMVANELSIIRETVFDKVYADSPKNVIHHVDHNRYNNSPENLVRMNFADHTAYHTQYGFSKEAQQLGTVAARARLEDMKANNPEMYKMFCFEVSKASKAQWKAMSVKERADRIMKISAGITLYFENRTPEQAARDYQTRIKNLKNANRRLQELLSISEFNEQFSKSIKQGWSKFKETQQFKNRSLKISEANKARHRTEGYTLRIVEQESLQFSKEMISTVQTLCKGKTTHQYSITNLVEDMNANSEMFNLFTSLNGTGHKPNFDKTAGFKPHHFTKMVKQFGYSSWRHFRKECELYNHKLVKVEYLDTPIEVGTLTIDQDEEFHDYHNFALDVGIFAQNSNLGEIDDLKYFTNKLFRGLRIPSSYLPTGADDSQAQFNDGRVGTAYIQELRFNNYCMRLQSLMQDQFDQDFKLYLYSRGVNIDSSLFELKFQPPQNFATYRQAELDNQRIATYGTISQQTYISKRFALKRYLGLSEEEIAENERLWAEENGKGHPAVTDASGELRGIGVSQADLTSDIGAMTDTTAPLGMATPTEPTMPTGPEAAPAPAIGAATASTPPNA